MLCPSAPGESADASMDDTVMDFMLCQLVVIAVLRDHVGLEVGDEGLEVGEHPLGRYPSNVPHMPHMQTKLSQSHIKKSNVQKCNAKDPNIELQAI
jgi:hypothetical protein